MTDIPVLFQPEMVEAIDADRKTATRRSAWGKAQPIGSTVTRKEREEIQKKGYRISKRGAHWYAQKASPWQKVKVGDRLWVREQHWRWGMWEFGCEEWHFKPASATMGNIFFGKSPAGKIGTRDLLVPAWHKRPSIFMPKELSRFTLIVTDIKVEPLQNISEADALAEGVQRVAGFDTFGVRGPSGGWLGSTFATAPEAFSYLWMSINGAESWRENSDVVATSFRVIRANIAEVSPPSTHIGRLAQSA